MLSTSNSPVDFVTRALDAHAQALAIYGTNGAPDRVKTLRRAALARFQELGVPGARNPLQKLREAYKYTDIAKVLRHPYAFQIASGPSRLTAADLAALPAFGEVRVVVVNGVFAPSLSALDGLPAGVVVTGLKAGLHDRPDLAEQHFGRYLAFDLDPFAALNTAFDLDGAFVYIPKGTVVEQPIHILCVTDSDADVVVQTRHLVIVEDGAQARLIESQHGHGAGASLGNHATELVVGTGAVLDHYRVEDEGERAVQVQATQLYQAGPSTVSTYTFTLDGALVRNNLSILPDASHCETHLLGLYIARGTQHVDNATFMDHAHAQCMSNELYKGIVDDRAQGVFNGRILVRRDAQQTNAYQQSKAVVLSEDARNYAKPELEIYADDVKCSHGSATGSLDEDALFYLRARGIAKSEAQALLLTAFAGEVLETIKVEPLRTWLEQRMFERLN